MIRKNKLEQNLSELKERIDSFARNEYTLVAVSKYSEFDDIKLLYELGHRDFGENRIEALEEKCQKAKDLGLNEIRWHFIGRVQSNKIKRICSINNLFAVHSISSLKHLRVLSKECEALEKKIGYFLQVNCSGEEQKDGLRAINDELVSAISTFESVEFLGLMTMAENRKNVSDEKVLNDFNHLKNLRDQFFPGTSLSMGMSADYDLALSCDSNYLRIGSTLFK